MKPSDTLRATMKGDPRSLHQLSRDSGVNVATLSRFGSGIRTLSQPASDALAMTLGLDYQLLKAKRVAATRRKSKGR